jgi:hypothetical protein
VREFARQRLTLFSQAQSVARPFYEFGAENVLQLPYLAAYRPVRDAQFIGSKRHSPEPTESFEGDQCI